MSEVIEAPERSYGCSRGCGNPYDFVMVSVSAAFTEFLCMPCFVTTAVGIIQGLTEPENEAVQAAMAEMPAEEQTPMNQPITRKRGHHAPAESDDEDLIASFDGVVFAEDLPDEFK